MSQALRFTALTICSLLLVSSVFVGIREFQYELHRDKYPIEVWGDLSPAEKEELEQELQEQAQGPFPLPSIFRRLAKFYLLESISSNDEELKERYSCSALRVLRKAMKQEPLESVFFKEYVRTKLLYSTKNCAFESPSLEIVEVLNKAIALNPHDPELYFFRTLQSRAEGDLSGEISAARDYFARITSDHSSLPHMLQYLSKGEFFSTVFPVDFVDGVKLAKFIFDNDEVLFLEIGDRVSEAILATAKSYLRTQADLDSSDLLESYGELLRLPVSVSLRRYLDKEMARLLRRAGRLELATHFEARSELKQLAAISGLKRRDSAPEKGSLSEWNLRAPIKVDRKMRSIGLALRRKQLVERVELSLNDFVSLSNLELWSSVDNVQWTLVVEQEERQIYQAPNSNVIVFHPEEVSARYWKIRYDGSSDGTSPQIRIGDSLRTYG